MKIKLFLLVGVFTISFTTAQTLYTVHDYDDCKTLSKGGNPALVDVTIPVANPDASDTANPNVTEFSPNAKNASVFLSLPVTVSVPSTTNTETLNYSLRYYSDAAGTVDSGSGRLLLRLFNQSVGAGAGNYIQFAVENKAGSVWTTLSGTINLDGTSQAVVDAGGYDSILFVLNNAAEAYTPTNDKFYLDDIKIDRNPALSDPTSDLLSGNSWIFNYSPDDFNKFYTQSDLTVEEGATTPTTVGNDSPTVFKINRGDATNPFVNFEIDLIDYRNGGKVKFRVYTECKTTVPSNVRFMLRKDNLGASQIAGAVTTVIPNIWNEIEVDLASLAGGAPEADGIYNNMLIFFNFGNSTQDAVGTVFYMDAFQAPTAAVLSNSVFSLEQELKLLGNPVKDKISLSKEVDKIEIFNSIGQAVLIRQNTNKEYDVSSLSNGIYILKATIENNSKTFKFIKE